MLWFFLFDFLIQVGDPTFIGYCVERKADCGAKCITKSGWDEQVGKQSPNTLSSHPLLGVICLNNAKFAVVEYSEIGAELAKSTNDAGTLVYNAANIANHFYTTDFLRHIDELGDTLAYHIARKKIAHVDLATGELVKPTASNGIKLELFIFDVFPYSQSMSVLEVERASEFSALKNKTGVDSAEVCPGASLSCNFLKLRAQTYPE